MFTSKLKLLFLFYLFNSIQVYSLVEGEPLKNKNDDKSYYTFSTQLFSLMEKMIVTSNIVDNNSFLISDKSLGLNVRFKKSFKKNIENFIHYRGVKNNYLLPPEIKIYNNNFYLHHIKIGRSYQFDPSWQCHLFFDVEQLAMINENDINNLKFITPWTYGLGIGFDYIYDFSINLSAHFGLLYNHNPTVKLKEVNIKKSSTMNFRFSLQRKFLLQKYSFSIGAKYGHVDYTTSHGNYLNKQIEMGVMFSKIIY